jgi:hypothetical protein
MENNTNIIKDVLDQRFSSADINNFSRGKQIFLWLVEKFSCWKPCPSLETNFPRVLCNFIDYVYASAVGQTTGCSVSSLWFLENATLWRTTISLWLSVVYTCDGRAVAQAVSRWLPTATARVRVRAGMWVLWWQSGTGSGFLRVLQFSLPIISPISPSS